MSLKSLTVSVAIQDTVYIRTIALTIANKHPLYSGEDFIGILLLCSTKVKFEPKLIPTMLSKQLHLFTSFIFLVTGSLAKFKSQSSIL